MLWDMIISKSLNRYLQRGKVKCARKTQITICVTLAVTLALEQVPKVHEVAHGPTINLDASKTLHWAGATPLLCTFPCPKVNRGSLQPNKKLPSVRAVRIWAKQEKKVGITYFSFAFTIFFSL